MEIDCLEYNADINKCVFQSFQEAWASIDFYITLTA